MQRVVEVLKVAVDEFGRVPAMFYDDAFRQEGIIERRCRNGPRDVRNRKRDDRVFTFPGQRRRALYACSSLLVEQRGRVLRERLRERHAGRGRDRGFRRAVRARPKANQPLLEHAAPWRSFALAGNDFGAWDVFVPNVLAADGLDVGVFLAVRARALDLGAVSRDLIVRADSILRELARLAVD